MAERQLAAQRLLFEVVDDNYDGELDIAWDRDPLPDVPWMPAELTSLYGTRVWNSLSGAQRDDLARRELVQILKIAMYLESAVSMLTFRTIAREQGYADDRTRYLLATINERSRNVTMFSRLINRTGVEPDLDQRRADRLARYVLLTPVGPLSRVLILLATEFVSAIAQAIAHAEDVQPHVLQLMKIHAVAGGRHAEFGRSELDEAVATGGGFSNRVQAILSLVLLIAIGPLLISRSIYEQVGISRTRATLAAFLGRQYRARTRLFAGAAADAADDAGLFGRVDRIALRLGRVA
ncbi:hypothetical protein GOALK_118_00120 [Gordonia alkanivorans NBRC 16433]|uniref:p-aminobenzoate N-oxygenase AurF n=2 Tax=Gordonia alkanivorans TaxID=84096 RepID=F9W234_9ACTN|nr:hypothetical protein GOALK_118_00120 [Gordonia alkanivorans NBRC 16433]